MVQRTKLELQLNQQTEVTLLYDTPITGESRYGSYYMYAVESDGVQYSFFATEEVHNQIKHLKKDDTFMITKIARQAGKKLMTEFLVEISIVETIPVPKLKETSAEPVAIPISNVKRDEAVYEYDRSDRFYDIMLQSYMDALNIAKELNGNANIGQIATTLFIARSK